MSDGLDSSVLIAALAKGQDFHDECSALVRHGGFIATTHALAETFCILTGGRLLPRWRAPEVIRAFDRTVLPRVALVTLPGNDFLSILRETEARGIRGGAIYDYLHLASMRSFHATRLYTLNTSNFLAFHRPGDPEIVHP